MSEPSSYLCLSCDEITNTGAHCVSCGSSLSIIPDDLSKLITRRLTHDGFNSVAEVLRDGDRLIPLAVALEKLSTQQHRDYLMLPGTTGDKVIYMLNIVEIISSDGLTPPEINRLATESYNVIRKTVKILGIAKTLFQVYAIYEDGCPLETIQAHNPRWRERLLNSTLSIIPIDCKKKKAYGGSIFIASCINVELALNQIGPITEPAEKPSYYLRLVKLIFKQVIQPILEYFRAYILIANPTLLAQRVVTDRIPPKELFSISSVSLLLAAAITSIFHMESGVFNLDLPLINGILNYLLLFIIYLLSTFIFYPPLKLVGGAATFKSTFIVLFYTGVLLSPILFLIVGVETFLGMEPEQAWKNTNNAALWSILPALGALHQLSLYRVFLAWLLPLFAIFAVFVGFALFV